MQEGSHSRGGSSAAARGWWGREVYIASGRMDGAGGGGEISWEIAKARWPYLGARAHDTHPSTSLTILSNEHTVWFLDSSAIACPCLAPCPSLQMAGLGSNFARADRTLQRTQGRPPCTHGPLRREATHARTYSWPTLAAKAWVAAKWPERMAVV